ncbi:hypothetical protein FRX31_001992 [Thalictrum thalictroides]|uniref:Uncharacterized protein n=1 Tax=Thalictrum thalictroides TaxID=46969 RepID=A0A7J6XH13_THATH|nr:hypothetical protein FRX31_001992 [Thalictrum thalictroides]
MNLIGQSDMDLGPNNAHQHIKGTMTHKLPGIQICEPTESSTIIKRRGRHIGVVGKGKTKIPFQMEEESRPYKKRKAEALEVLLHGPSQVNNLKEMATMWESMTNPRVINFLVANRLLDLSGNQNEIVDLTSLLEGTSIEMFDADEDNINYDYQMQLALMNKNLLLHNSYQMLAIPTPILNFENGFFTFDNEESGESRTGQIDGLEALVEGNNLLLIPSTINTNNQVSISIPKPFHSYLFVIISFNKISLLYHCYSSYKVISSHCLVYII